MKRFRKVFSIVVVCALLVVFGLIVLGLRMSFANSNQSIIKAFKEDGINLLIDSIRFQGKNIRYMECGSSNAAQSIIFIHGAPGSMDMFSKIMKDKYLRNNFRLIAVDRLGYGFSNSGHAQTSLGIQAKSIASLIQQKIPNQTIILFGHSFGAPIAALVGKENPNQIKHVVLAGGAVSPKHERFVWLAKLCNTKIIQWIGSNDTHVSTLEKLSHQEELEKIQDIWANYPTQLLTMHGKKDWLVPYENLLFLKKRVPKENFVDYTLPKESHFFIQDVNLLKSVFLQLKN